MMPPAQQQSTHFQGAQYGQTNQYAQYDQTNQNAHYGQTNQYAHSSQPIYDEPSKSGYSGGGFTSKNPA